MSKMFSPGNVTYPLSCNDINTFYGYVCRACQTAMTYCIAGLFFTGKNIRNYVVCTFYNKLLLCFRTSFGIVDRLGEYSVK